MSDGTLRPRRPRLSDVIADKRIISTLSFEDMVGIIAEVYVRETTEPDARLRRENIQSLLDDPRKFETLGYWEKVQLAMQAYINVRVEDALNPLPPGGGGTPLPPGSPPGAPMISAPPNASTNRERDILTLAWDAQQATTYDVYFGPAQEPPLLSLDQPAVTFNVTNLQYDTPYYWRVVARNEYGTTLGPLWSFTTKVQTPADPDPDPPPPDEPPPPPAGTVPAKALLLTPANAGNNISRTPELGWTGNGTSYEVNFGTANPPPLVGTQVGTTYAPAGTLNYGTTYYWRIDSINVTGETVGDVWSFNTLAEPVSAGNTIIVLGGAGSASAFQNALNAAQPGDTIRLEAGQTFTGNFIMPDKATGSTQEILITTTNPLTAPSATERMNPTVAQTFNLPKLQSPNNQGALQAALYTHHWRIKHLEFLHGLGGTPGGGQAVSLGSGGTDQNTLEKVPHHLVLEGCYIHGSTTFGLKRGVGFNCAYGTVIRCHIDECWYPGADSQTILGWNGPGPFLIEDNYLVAGSENIMFGGADPAITNLVPADITIIGNHMTKPWEWLGQSNKQVKNVLEFKTGRRILVQYNLIERCWVAAQSGSGLNWKSVNQDGSHTLSRVEELLFRDNVIRDMSQAFSWLDVQVGAAGLPNPLPARGFELINNLFYRINSSDGKGGSGKFMHTTGIADVIMHHNTVFHGGLTFMSAGDRTNANWEVRFNAFHDVPGGYGVKGDGQVEGTGGTFPTWFTGINFTKNLLADFNSARYDVTNYFPATLAAAMYNDAANPETGAILHVDSPYKNVLADQVDALYDDPGCNLAALAPAFAAVKPWTVPGEPPPPPPPEPPPPGVSLSKVAWFDSPTSAVTVTYPISGLTFTPKLGIFMGGNHGNGDIQADDHHKFFGVVTSPTSQQAGGAESEDGLVTSNVTVSQDNAAAIRVPAVSGGHIIRGVLTAWDATSITINWTKAWSSPIRVSVLLLGHANLQVQQGLLSAPTVTGAVDYTPLAWAPDALMLWSMLQSATIPLDTYNYSSTGSIGMATGPISQAMSGWRTVSAVNPARSSSRQLTSKVFSSPNLVGLTNFREASLTAILANGWTLNWDTANATAARMFYLALRGIPFKVVPFTVAPDGAGVQVITGVGFKPSAIFAVTANRAANASTIAHWRSTWGLTDGTAQLSIFGGDRDGVSPSIATTRQDRGRFLRIGSEVTGLSMTTDASCSVTSLDNDGWTMLWDIRTVVGQQVIAFVIG
ncbi:MAG: hypothetical protein H0W42_03055 [Gemmatimonadaceae bacterium]|nr:hypothetical protein [Gemmatimonadaceae bacterium]